MASAKPSSNPSSTTDQSPPIWEPPQASLVGEALIEAIRTGSFHVFPDTMAKQIGRAYQSFAENVVEASMSDG